MNYIKIIVLFIIIFQSISTSGQDFLTELIFEDALGNYDTLEVGYDQSATVGVDTFLGEENIIMVPRDSIFDVRSSNEPIRRNQGLVGTFHTKRQIIPNPCSLPNEPDTLSGTVISIDVMAKYWPVKMYWNNDFLNDCVDSSWITNMLPSSWCDAICQPHIYEYMYSASGQSIEIEKPSRFDESGCAYTVGLDSVAFLSVVLFDDQAGCPVTVGLREYKKTIYNVYPNPASKIFHIKYKHYTNESNFILYNVNGEVVLSKKLTSDFSSFNLNDVSSGNYIYTINSEDGTFQKGKLIISR